MGFLGYGGNKAGDNAANNAESDSFKGFSFMKDENEQAVPSTAAGGSGGTGGGVAANGKMIGDCVVDSFSVFLCFFLFFSRWFFVVVENSWFVMSYSYLFYLCFFFIL